MGARSMAAAFSVLLATVTIFLLFTGVAVADEPLMHQERADIITLESALGMPDAIAGKEVGVASTKGWITLTSHEWDRKYVYPRGATVRVTSTVYNPDWYWWYTAFTIVWDTKAKEVVSARYADVPGNQTWTDWIADMSLSGLSVSDGRYEIHVVLWDSLWDELIDQEQFTLAVTSTSISATAPATAPFATKTTVMKGYAKDSLGRAVSNRTVWLQRSNDGKTGWTNVTSQSSRSSGWYSFAHVLRSNLYYRVRFSGDASFAAANSPTRFVRVVPNTKLSATAPTTIARGTTATVMKGYLKDTSNRAVVDRTVWLQRSSDGKSGWTNVARRQTTANGWYSFTDAPVRNTYYRVRFSGDSSYSVANSPTRFVRAVPNTTLSATAPTTIALGTTATVMKGYLKDTSNRAVVDRTVWLQRSSDGKSGWTNVARRQTTASGWYSFTDAPVRNTYYRVRFSGDSSYSAANSPTRFVTVK